MVTLFNLALKLNFKMKIKCTKRLSCNSYHCCCQEGLSNDTPVHSPCDWYEMYRERKIKLEKLFKLCSKVK